MLRNLLYFKEAGHDGVRFSVFGWLRKDHYFKSQPGQFRETMSEKKELWLSSGVFIHRAQGLDSISAEERCVCVCVW